MNDETAVQTSQVDRELMARDLARLGELLAPLMLARLAVLRDLRQEFKIGPFRRTVPVGAVIYNRLSGFLPQAIFGALASINSLTDDELVPLSAVIAGELGAWCRARGPLADDELAAGLPGLVALMGERPPEGWQPDTDIPPESDELVVPAIAAGGEVSTDG